nr:MAG TPA: hypothetical protein [Caudoviricetes sp.]
MKFPVWPSRRGGWKRRWTMWRRRWAGWGLPGARHSAWWPDCAQRCRPPRRRA